MAENTYTLPANPEYHTDIPQLKRSDPADAETTFNPLIQKLLENTHFVKLFAEALAKAQQDEDATVRAEITAHSGRKNNPHGVTAAQAGAVPTGRKVNGKALSADISLSAADVGAAASGHTHNYDAAGSAAAVQTSLNSHAGNKSNPHGVTAAQAGRFPLAERSTARP